MSLAQKAARGALWTIATSIGGRVIGVLGTLIMTRFMAPDAIGEVSVATIIAMTANWASIWGFGPYAIVKSQKPEDAREVMWHCTVAYLVLGVIGLGGVALFGGPLTALFDAPTAARFVPGAALAIFIRRFSSVAERALVREMRFREIGIALAIGELTYTITALTLAANEWGGMAIIVGNLVQATVTSGLIIRASGMKSWATPTPLRKERFRDMLRFGLPLAVESVAHNGSRYWDNLLMARYFGPSVTGVYNMAYNLADIPAIQVGEQIASVLLPSMSKLEPARRPRALERSTALLSLLIFPMAIGLGLIAQPLIELVLPSDKWQEVAPLLTILAVLSVFRPITWVLSVYMDAQERTMRLMLLEVAKIILLMIGIAVFSPWGVRASAAAVGLAFGVSAIAGVGMVAGDGVSLARLVRGFFEPLAACALMCGAVLAVRYGVPSFEQLHPGAKVAIEIGLGGIVYSGAALLLCRATAKDLLGLLRGAMKKS
ncbi:MAG: oligosaccharide flippase family protein [Kofleriaceae bacterium]|nr:oligosaccharide flippase family protein [Kofleriaceae bacterium]